jgi:hypothetical protein
MSTLSTIFTPKYIKSKKFENISPYFNDWNKNLNTILHNFDLSFFHFSKLLILTNSCIAGGSVLCAFSQFCNPEDYDGDIDIFINFSSRDFNRTDLLFDLSFTALGYSNFDDWSKYKKPDECPVCYHSQNDIKLKLLQPCEHWLCEECYFKLSNLPEYNKKCPLCRSNLFTKHPLFLSENEVKELTTSSNTDSTTSTTYAEVINIRHFKVYKNEKGKTIQLIYINNFKKDIDRFDLSFCQIYYDGEKLYAKYPEQTLLREGFLVHPNKLTEKQKNRIKKYSERGFSISSFHPIHHKDTINELPIEDDIKKYILNQYI